MAAASGRHEARLVVQGAGVLIAESGVDRGSDSGVEVEARIDSYVRSSQCRIDPSNGQSPVV